MTSSLAPSRKRYVLFGIAAVVAILVSLVVVSRKPVPVQNPQPSSPFSSPVKQKGPPWIYGRADARFTIVEYADFECPYCREYFPVMQQWIKDHPHVNWQWHHFPLAMHDPAASNGARVAECAGETGGADAFWNMVAWVYTHTRGDGMGLPADAQPPGMSTAMKTCLDSTRPGDIIRMQTEAAARDGVTAVPTLQLHDRQSQKTVTLHGPIDGDGLLSAIDFLLAGDVQPQ